MTKAMRALTLTTILSFVADQLTKVWARSALKPIFPQAKTVIAGFWDMRYSENPGSAFSMFGGINGAKYFLSVLGIAAVVYIFYYVRKLPADQVLAPVWLGLIAGGAAGNVVDRVIYGVVTDFISWRYENHVWPTFNIADVTLVAGVIGLALFGGKKDKPAPTA